MPAPQNVKMAIQFLCVVLLGGHLCADDVPSRQLPQPNGIKAVRETERFGWLLDNMKRDHVCFEYLKLRYFTLPTTRKGLFPNVKPGPQEALKVASKRVWEHEKAKKGITVDWVYWKATLAWGERCANLRGELDGGRPKANRSGDGN